MVIIGWTIMFVIVGVVVVGGGCVCLRLGRGIVGLSVSANGSSFG